MTQFDREKFKKAVLHIIIEDIIKDYKEFVKDLNGLTIQDKLNIFQGFVKRQEIKISEMDMNDSEFDPIYKRIYSKYEELEEERRK